MAPFANSTISPNTQVVGNSGNQKAIAQLDALEDQDKRTRLFEGISRAGEKISRGFQGALSGLSDSRLEQTAQRAAETLGTVAETLAELLALAVMFYRKSKEKDEIEKNNTVAFDDNIKVTGGGVAQDFGEPTTSAIAVYSPPPKDTPATALVPYGGSPTKGEGRVIEAEWIEVPEESPVNFKATDGVSTRDVVLQKVPQGKEQEYSSFTSEYGDTNKIINEAMRVAADCEVYIGKEKQYESFSIELTKGSPSLVTASLNQIKLGVDPLDIRTVAENPLLGDLVSRTSNSTDYEKLLRGNSDALKFALNNDPGLIGSLEDSRKIIVYAGLKSSNPEVSARAFGELRSHFNMQYLENYASDTTLSQSKRVSSINNELQKFFGGPVNLTSAASGAVTRASMIPDEPKSAINS